MEIIKKGNRGVSWLVSAIASSPNVDLGMLAMRSDRGTDSRKVAGANSQLLPPSPLKLHETAPTPPLGVVVASCNAACPLAVLADREAAVNIGHRSSTSLAPHYSGPLPPLQVVLHVPPSLLVKLSLFFTASTIGLERGWGAVQPLTEVNRKPNNRRVSGVK